jgi:hypothetical protein
MHEIMSSPFFVFSPTQSRRRLLSFDYEMRMSESLWERASSTFYLHMKEYRFLQGINYSFLLKTKRTLGCVELTLQIRSS